jgi:hypothetical protein
MHSLSAVLLTRGGIAVDLEAEQHLLRAIDRVGFLETVLNSRVNAIARNGQVLPIRADVEHVIVERIRAVEVFGWRSVSASGSPRRLALRKPA